MESDESESESCKDEPSDDNLQASLGKPRCLSAEYAVNADISRNSESARALTTLKGLTRKRSKSQTELKALQKLTLPLPQPYNAHDGPLKLGMVTQLIMQKLI